MKIMAQCRKTTDGKEEVMNLEIVTETARYLWENTTLTEKDREVILQFAFRTGDRELADCLTRELAEAAGYDKSAIYRKYQTLSGQEPGWTSQIENLLVALEAYRVQKEIFIKKLEGLLSAYDILLRKDVIQAADRKQIQKMTEKDREAMPSA